MKKGFYKYLLIILFLNSCAKDSGIEITFVNNSNYELDEFVFNLSKQHDTISLKIGESYNRNFKYVHHWAYLFSEPTLNLFVKRFSDKDSTYTHRYGKSKPRSQLDREKRNLILIKFDTIYKKFDFELKN